MGAELWTGHWGQGAWNRELGGTGSIWSRSCVDVLLRYWACNCSVGILEIPITSAVVFPYCHTKATVCFAGSIAASLTRRSTFVTFQLRAHGSLSRALAEHRCKICLRDLPYEGDVSGRT